MIFDQFGEGLPVEEPLWMPEVLVKLNKELFELAHNIREMEPWRKFSEEDWFGVEDPETGEIQIVSVLGMSRQVYAVQLYLPEEGIRFLNDLIVTGRTNHNAMLFDLRMIECEFCGKEALADEDREMNELHPPKGTRRKGAGYVSFRSHCPEHYPWFIEEDEGRMMANALRLLPVFADFGDDVMDEKFYHTPKGELPDIPIFKLNEGGDVRNPNDWVGRVELFPVASPKQLPEVPKDDVFYARMAKLVVKDGTIWEIGSFFLPGPTKMGDRLVYPSLTVAVPHEVNELPEPLIGSPADCRMVLLRKAFSAMAEQLGYLPGTLIVASPLAELVFYEVSVSSGMAIHPVDVLPNLSSTIEAFVNSALERPMGEIKTASADALDMSGEPKYRKPMCAERFVMRVDLVGAKPPIWRRISMPVDASFFDLHVAIQEAMGWKDCHLHSFEIREGQERVALIEWSIEEDDFPMFDIGVERLPELGTTLFEIVERGYRKFHYCYDFGDDWRHVIQIEKLTRPGECNPLPELLKGRGACPPENCGGIWGYQALLEGNPEFAEGWSPGDLKRLQEAKFDPKDVTFTPGEDSYERWIAMRDVF